MATKKIGILHGMETTFPPAFVDEINKMGLKDIKAEPVLLDIVQQGEPIDYAVIIDRISQDVPFYRAAMKNAASTGTAVINNPFWFSADEKFFNNALAVKVGVPVPNTVLLPSNERPDDTTEKSFRNLKFPMSWDKIFDYIGFPAYMKPHNGGGWKSVYRVTDPQDLWTKLGETQQLVMMLQEEIIFEDYFRCYCIGRKYVHIMQYEPRNPHHLRYVSGRGPAEKKLLDLVTKYVLLLNEALGYDFNTVEFAVRNGVPYAIDFCNPAPDADVNSVGQDNFDWVVQHSAKYAVEKAQSIDPKKNNLTWGTFVSNGVADMLTAPAKPKTTKK
jgi:glutathione synthase/RimK-type ligase-like ATP-grasp enzyme